MLLQHYNIAHGDLPILWILFMYWYCFIQMPNYSIMARPKLMPPKNLNSHIMSLRIFHKITLVSNALKYHNDPILNIHDQLWAYWRQSVPKVDACNSNNVPDSEIKSNFWMSGIPPTIVVTNSPLENSSLFWMLLSINSKPWKKDLKSNQYSDLLGS